MRRILRTRNSSLSGEEFFVWQNSEEMISLETLEQLQVEEQELRNKEPKGWAGAMLRHQKLHEIEEKIKYLQHGDFISKEDIQVKVEEINTLQEEANELSKEIAKRKRELFTGTFGPEASHLLK